MPLTDPAIAGRRAIRLVARGMLAAGLAVAIAGCKTTARDVTGSVPVDYRERHPIAIKEGKHALTLFVGNGRGGLTPAQRAEVLSFAQTWKRDATGGITVDRPVGTPNERAARDTLKQVLSIFAAAGIPNNGIGVNPYTPDEGELATLRIKYPQIRATAGPCGLWPDDLGPSNDLKHFDNQPFYNLGCATQRNLAAMVDNPHDLVQPRAETPPYAGKRSVSVDKWRRGESPATTYPNAGGASVSDVGK